MYDGVGKRPNNNEATPWQGHPKLVLLSMLRPTLKQFWARRSRLAVIDYNTPAIQAIAHALERGSGSPPVYMRGGGPLPIVADFQDLLAVPIVLIGFGMPDDNTHAPNEKYHLPNFRRGTETLIHFFSILPTMPAG